MSSIFRVPPGTNELITRHLVTSAEIARRTGVSRAAVANWTARHPEFAALAIPLSTDADQVRSYVFWWPEVEACLSALGIPNQAAMRRGRKPAPVYPEPGSNIPGQPGYVVGTCGHRVAGSEWKAGFRTCEHCPDKQDGGDSR